MNNNTTATDKPFVLDKIGNSYRLTLKAVTHAPDTFKDVNALIDHIQRHNLIDKISGLTCLPQAQYNRLFPVLHEGHAVQLMNRDI